MGSKGYVKGRVDRINEAINGIGKEYGGKRYLNIDSEDTYKLSAGKNTIRIMPPINPDDFYGKIIYVHNNVGLDEDGYLCLDKNYGEKCPVCEYQKMLKKSGASKEELYPYYPKKRYLFNVVDLDEPKKGVRVLNCPPTLAEEILRQSKNQRTGEVIDVSDEYEGFDIFIDREGEGLTTKYHAVLDREPTQIENEKWLDQLIDLDAIVVRPTADAMKESLGLTDEPVAQDEPDPEYRRGRRSASEETVDEEKEVKRGRRQENEEAGEESRTRKGRAEAGEEAAKEEEVGDIKARIRARMERRG